MSAATEHVVCVKNRGFAASLEVGKVYRALGGRLADRVAERDGLLRIIDESGDDYLYPRSLFVTVALPALAAKAIAKTRRGRGTPRQTETARPRAAGGSKSSKGAVAKR